MIRSTHNERYGSSSKSYNAFRKKRFEPMRAASVRMNRIVRVTEHNSLFSDQLIT